MKKLNQDQKRIIDTCAQELAELQLAIDAKYDAMVLSLDTTITEPMSSNLFDYVYNGPTRFNTRALFDTQDGNY